MKFRPLRTERLSLFRQMKILRTLAALLVATIAAPATMRAQTGQFAPLDPTASPPHTFNKVEGEWVNLETELIQPVLVDDALDLVAVCNEADNRVVFFNRALSILRGETVVGQGPTAMALSGNELWVSVRHQSSVIVIELTNYSVTHVLRPPIPDTPTNGPGAREASTLGGIVITQGRAYVASMDTDRLLVFDVLTKASLPSIELEKEHPQSGSPLVSLNDPYSVVMHNGLIWVLSHLSGNNTTARIAGGLDLDDPNTSADDLGPDQVSVVDLDSMPGLDLPDFDIAVVDPGSNTVVNMVKGTGTLLFGLASDTKKDRLIVSNLESRNAEFIGESSFPGGRVVFNRLSFVDPATQSVTQTLDTEFLGGNSEHIVMPTDIVVLPTGRIFVAGYSSSNIGVWNKDLVYEGSLSTDAGPRGLAVSRALARLYCLNRAAGTVMSYDLTGNPLPTFLTRVTLPDPTYDNVKQGRIEFLKPNSGSGTTNCGSCHIDGRKDGLGWNLSKLLADDPDNLPMSHDPLAPDFRDRKGVMVTQDLRDIEGVAPYHWRGEQQDLENFSGAFVELLRGKQPTEDEFAVLKDYVFSLEYPPNPFQQLNREYDAQATAGLGIYGTGPLDSCNRCHQLPHGTDADITGLIRGDEATPKVVKAATLRGMWTKESDKSDIDSDPVEEELVNVMGFGLVHEGVTDDLEQFFLKVMGGLPDPARRAAVKAFLAQLDAGLAPSTMYSEILDASAAPQTVDRIEGYLINQADLRYCDLAVRGRIEKTPGTFVNVGLYYDRANGDFVADDSSLNTTGRFTFGELEDQAQLHGAVLLFMGVPPGSGQRIGVDRDRDGYFDTDEVMNGLNPVNPDTDGDGLWDGFDPLPNQTGHPLPPGAPQVSGVELVFANTNCIAVRYETNVPSPTIIRFSHGGPTYEWGDGLQTYQPATVNNRQRRIHTAFIRPVPRQGLHRLRPNTLYTWEIVTQGQNGEVAIYPQQPLSTDPNVGDTFRTATIRLLENLDLGGGVFQYKVEVGFKVTQGVSIPPSLEVPARFTLYDAAGNYITANVYVPLNEIDEKAIFTFQTPAGAQMLGDRVTFDLPMWLVPDGATDPKIFPGMGGQWPEGPSHLEWSAGSPP